MANYKGGSGNYKNRNLGIVITTSSDHDITTSTTLEDTVLLQVCATTETWAFFGSIDYEDNGGGHKHTMAYTGTEDDASIWVENAQSVAIDTTESSTTTHTWKIWGIIYTTSAGNLKFQFAQNSSNAGASKLLTGSYIRFTKLT